MTTMPIREFCRRWAGGWRDLIRHDGVQAYRALGLCQRLRADLSVMADALGSPRFWVGALWLAAGVLGAEILIFEHDLTGWRRDALQCLPVLLAAPRVAAGRRRLLERRLGAK